MVVLALIFGQQDVVIIARTSAGNFQAFTLLTGVMTLQIVPLTRITEEQGADREQAIRQLRPADTLKKDPDMLKDIKNGKYNHIICSPEQAVTPAFQDVVRAIKQMLGLWVWDEAHLHLKWNDFRNSYGTIHLLRQLMSINTVLLACSATVSDETEK
ncbi:hypothetical protein AC579_3452 [Pseudocercospora musae]|uniref:DNA 3'-5' helicase n=1 Tax=Pseudocercospora musae TaxID=113226 RepID=A0A139HVE4_9PEZI|nr:hypothetical protein AC579_3452 [Pseudocercospora musae]